MTRDRASIDSGWGLGILAWALHLGLSYGVVGWYCREPRNIAAGEISLGLHAITLLCALLALTGIALARRNLRVARQASHRERSRFMAWSGLISGCFFLVVILVQGWPNLWLEPC